MDSPIISVEQMRKSDEYTINNLTTARELMYRAATGVYESYSRWENKKIAIVAGSGNNGGDGYALACILIKNRIPSVIYKVSEAKSDEGKLYMDAALSSGVEIKDLTEETDLSGYDVVVDCILGTGFTGEVRGNAKTAIDKINESDAYVISVDINSGMNGDTGEAACAVKSDLTVSIGYIKKGLVTEAAKKYIGKLVNVEIGIVLV